MTKRCKRAQIQRETEGFRHYVTKVLAGVLRWTWQSWLVCQRQRKSQRECVCCAQVKKGSAEVGVAKQLLTLPAKMTQFFAVPIVRAPARIAQRSLGDPAPPRGAACSRASRDARRPGVRAGEAKPPFPPIAAAATRGQAAASQTATGPTESIHSEDVAGGSGGAQRTKPGRQTVAGPPCAGKLGPTGGKPRASASAEPACEQRSQPALRAHRERGSQRPP